MTTDRYEQLNAEALEFVRTAWGEKRLSGAPPGRIVFATLTGGHAYGFPSEDSDVDIRGSHVLPAQDLLGLRAPQETFEITGQWLDGVEIDLVSHDLKKYLGLLMKSGGNMLEQLFSPLVVQASESFDELRELSRGAITKNVGNHYRGFFRRQFRMVEKEAPLRTKTVLYLFRVVMTGTHLLRTGEVETNIRVLNEEFQISYLPSLWDAKVAHGEKALIPEEDQRRFLEDAAQLDEGLSEALTLSPLPEEVTTFDALDDLLLRLRQGRT